MKAKNILTVVEDYIINEYKKRNGKIWCTVKLNNDYMLIHDSIVHNKQLSLRAKGLYLLILTYLNKNINISKEFLLNECCEGEKAFNATWKELKESGYLKQHKLRRGNNVFYYEYELITKFENEMEDELIQSDNESNNTPGYIYVMKCFNCYKIGKSKNCARLGEYTNLPEEPKYYVLKYVNDMDKVESILHENYSDLRTRSGRCEWFMLSDNDINDIRNIIKPYVVEDVEHTKYYYEYYNNNKEFLKED